MNWQFAPYIAPLTISAIASAAIAIYAWRRRAAAGAAPFAVVMCGCAQWSLASALQWGSADLPAQLFWYRMRFLGTETISVALLACALQYVGNTKWVTRRNLALALILPLTSLAALWTNERHGLFLRDVRLDSGGPFAALDVVFGPWFWLHTAYDYLLLTGALVLFAQAFLRLPRLYRGQIGALIVGTLAPISGNLLTLTGLSPFPHLDLTPLGFTVTGIALAIGLFRYRIFDVAPVARDAVWQGIDEAVVVVDAQDRIVDLNPAAQQIIGRGGAQAAIGRPAAEVWPDWLRLAERQVEAAQAPVEVALGEGELQRHFDLRLTPLLDRDGRLHGRLAVLHDFTQRKRAEQELRHSENTTLSILENIEDAYYEADLTGKLTFVNQAFCSHMGYTKEEVIGRHYRHFTAPKYVRPMFQIFNRVYRTGEPYRGIEYNLRRKDGTFGLAEGSVSLIRDSAGQPLGFRGIMRDITDRKLAQEAMQKAKEAAERELEIGRQIQAGFFPRTLPQPPGWEIAAAFLPARQVAGDFYDAFTLAHGHVGIVISDVCDKGVGAALFMGLFRSLVRAFADQHYANGQTDQDTDALPAASTGLRDRRSVLTSVGAAALKNTVVRTNNYIAHTHGHANMFATLFFGVLDPATGRLLYINGGHESPAIVDSTGVKSRLTPTGPAVGMLPDMDFEVQEAVLEPGDTLIAFTDGVTEARGSGDQFFTEERLLSIVQQPFPSADALLNRIEALLYAHTAEVNPSDDITLLAVRRASGAEP